MNVFLLCSLLLGVGTVCFGKQRDECLDGKTKTVDCNNCSCRNGKWQCSTKTCSPKQQCISGQVKSLDCNNCYCANGKWTCSSRICPPAIRPKRGVPVGTDLKNTPCAPNDYFKIDCNTCYCNIEKTGYLCTENLCNYTDTSSSSHESTDDTLSLNYTSINVTVPQVETVDANLTLIEDIGENTTNTLEIVTEDLEYSATIKLNVTQHFHNNSSNYSDSDSSDTSKSVNITHS